MGVETKRTDLISHLFLAPLSLDVARASCLLNMAALEMCTTSNFRAAKDEDSAVCSYLFLLATLGAKEEDVEKLRTKHILLGGGFSNKEVIHFLTNLHGLRIGRRYVRTMIKIEHCKIDRRTWTKFYAFYYRNKTTIAQIGSVIVGTATIVGTILAAVKR